MGDLKRKNRKRIRNILIFLAASLFIVLLLDNTAMMMYPVKYGNLVQRYAEEYSIDPLLVFAMIRVESNFDPDALSPKNAAGLMQITEKTGKWGAQKLEIANFNKGMLYDPDVNIRIGCWYLSVLYSEFKDIDLVITAYNAGSGNVEQWLADGNLSVDGKTLDRIPFPETERYRKKVNNSWKIYKTLYEKRF